MDVNTLGCFLDKLGITRDRYTVADSPGHDLLLIYEENNQWVTCYSEKGVKFNEKRFDTEAEACFALINDFLTSSFEKKRLKLSGYFFHKNQCILIFKCIPNIVSNTSWVICIDDSGEVIWQSNLSQDYISYLKLVEFNEEKEIVITLQSGELIYLDIASGLINKTEHVQKKAH